MSNLPLASAASAASTLAPLRVVNEEIESAALLGNRYGDPTRRLTPVILPPSYDRDTQRRYPVIYLLAAFTGTGWQLLGRSPLAESLDERIARLFAEDSTTPEFITVLPDCFTALGGSQYVNSPGLGRYEDHVVREVVPHIDRRYRTLAAPAHRGVIGRSSGGIGSLWLAMNHPDVFGAVGSHAGDGHFRLSLPPELNKFCRRVRRYGGPEGTLKHWLSLSRGGTRPGELFDVMTIFASAAAYSPDADAPLGFRLPIDCKTAELDEEIFARWLRFDPTEICSEPVYRDALASMRLIFLDAGTRDEYYLDHAARRFASRLGTLGIRHTHEEFDDGHMNTNYRFDRSLPLLARSLA